jgi:ABC-type Fe3+ transport system substrate-binding protein
MRLSILLASLWLLGACGPVAPTTGMGGASTEAATNAAWEIEWNRLAEAARSEGKVVVKGGTSDEIRAGLSPLFSRRFGVEVEYQGGTSSEFAVQAEKERAAGLYTVDVVLGGAAVMYPTIYQNNWLDPLLPQLTHPEALDTSKWPNGKLWFMDPEQTYILRLGNAVTPMMYVNTSQIKPGEIRSWQDLLKPEYRGKIATHDPEAQGNGHAVATIVYMNLGEDFFRSLYVEQRPTVMRDAHQLADALARGTHSIVLGLSTDEFDKIKDEGFPVDVLMGLPELPPTVGGFPLMGLMNNAPHPSAAKLFVNWAASKEGMEFLTKTAKYVPVRSDTDKSGLPAYLIPQPGVDYYDYYEWDFAVNQRLPLSAKVRSLLR